MILIFGYGLVYWTGIITGLLFLLSFFGCCCHLKSRICNSGIIGRLKRYHKPLIYSAMIFFIVHGTLAVLMRYGIVI